MKKRYPEKKPALNLPATPLLIVISGPSGAGKDAVLTRMRETGYPIEYITTLTTRTMRPGEQDMRDYHFVPAEKFPEMIAGGELLEWAEVYGNWYGVPKLPVKQALDRGQDVIVKVDIQGAATIKKLIPQAVLVFLTSPSPGELAHRLKQRHTESSFDLALRLSTAEAELAQLPRFDYVVVNRQDEIDGAVSQIEAIITAEKCRVIPREIEL